MQKLAAILAAILGLSVLGGCVSPYAQQPAPVYGGFAGYGSPYGPVAPPPADPNFGLGPPGFVGGTTSTCTPSGNNGGFTCHTPTQY